MVRGNIDPFTNKLEVVLVPALDAQSAALGLSYMTTRKDRWGNEKGPVWMTFVLPPDEAYEAIQILEQYPNEGLTLILDRIDPRLKNLQPWDSIQQFVCAEEGTDRRFTVYWAAPSLEAASEVPTEIPEIPDGHLA